MVVDGRARLCDDAIAGCWQDVRLGSATFGVGVDYIYIFAACGFMERSCLDGWSRSLVEAKAG